MYQYRDGECNTDPSAGSKRDGRAVDVHNNLSGFVRKFKHSRCEFWLGRTGDCLRWQHGQSEGECKRDVYRDGT